MRGLESGREVLRKLQWRRGLRAGLAVAAAMIVCRALGRPMGWAALGAFEVILVDNGGPYRSRLATMSTVLAGGAVACVLGAMAPEALWGAALLTAAVCFVVTFARVISQPIASTSVIILVIYFAGYGGEHHTLQAATEYATEVPSGRRLGRRSGPSAVAGGSIPSGANGRGGLLCSAGGFCP